MNAPLFGSFGERLVAFGVLLVLFLANLGLEYHTYQNFWSKKRRYTQAQVLNRYRKRGHWVLRLRSKEGASFYTTSNEDLKDLRGRRVELLLFGQKPIFFDYLHSFYAPSYIIGVLPKNLRESLWERIASQHQSQLAKELFGTLFLAMPIQRDFRQMLSNFGISHLVAISGFHMGLLFGFFSFMLYFVLRPVWQSLWPWANLKRLVFALAFAAVVGYAAFLGLVPSVVRSATMMGVGLFMLDRGLKLLSFETLGWIVLLVLALWPRLLWSVGFWFSVTGVFYIYLFLHHFKLSKLWTFLLLNFWVFLAMLPLSLFVFGMFNPWMLLSPLLSILFVLFYPLALLLHFVGYGGVLDGVVEMLGVAGEGVRVELPLWLFGLYLLASLLAIWRPLALYAAYSAFGIFLIYQVA